MKVLWRENLGIGTAPNLDAAFSFSGLILRIWIKSILILVAIRQI